MKAVLLADDCMHRARAGCGPGSSSSSPGRTAFWGTCPRRGGGDSWNERHGRAPALSTLVGSFVAVRAVHAASAAAYLSSALAFLSFHEAILSASGASRASIFAR